MFRGILIWWMLSGSLLAIGTPPDSNPVPNWVVPLSYEPRAKLELIDPALEMRWILQDWQFNAQSSEAFHHEVRQIQTVAGLNNGSHISVEFDPSFQNVQFHWIKIWRGTNAFSRLDPEKLQTSAAGLDEEEMLISSNKTVTAILNDVRVGDVIDYAYTIQGANPALGGYFGKNLVLQSDAPIEQLTIRLLWPNKRLLYVMNHGTDVKYTAVRKGEMTEFGWNLKRINGWRDESALPGWFLPFPFVQLSEFHLWPEVNALYLTLFTNTAASSPEIAGKLAELKKLPTLEKRVLEALRFVQDDIRYLGIEAGAGGYTPASPATVLSRRYGDCKDKTFLLVTLLHGLGVQADPVLVNTRMRRAIAQLHASATIFDHAVTQATVDGRTYWLDATANYQRGPLATRWWPDYGYGLVVKRGTTALTPIPPCPVQPVVHVNQYFQIGNYTDRSQLKVVTVAMGHEADRARARFIETPRADIERHNLDYYAQMYPEISKAAPVQYIDDEVQNRVEVDEFYDLGHVWMRQAGDTAYHSHFYPENLELLMKTPGQSARTMPLALAYPTHQFFHAEFVLALPLPVTPTDNTIHSLAFYFHRAVSVGNGKVFLDYEYRTLSDAVLPADMPTYLQQLSAAQEFLGFSLTSNY